ncbi:MAG TPA: hypothetical protein VFA75_09990 [Nevskia sp.]|nr:hypothetical protein [Nevskia sp.]
MDTADSRFKAGVALARKLSVEVDALVTAAGNAEYALQVWSGVMEEILSGIVMKEGAGAALMLAQLQLRALSERIAEVSAAPSRARH